MDPIDEMLLSQFMELTKEEQLMISSGLSIHFGVPIEFSPSGLSKRCTDEKEICKNVLSGFILTKKHQADIREAHERLKNADLPQKISFGRLSGGTGET
ncbi:hypothetical protein ACFSR7_26610 [Cohnella sp. GCM10020058]|uniref:hypothetical protein n=1 Tax=Cohnella sp. GCM10020058 TaxID=3317330 RepID=UPI00362C8663